MKAIAAYIHAAPEPLQEPDPRAGAYYVSVRDHGRTALLCGPFPLHVMALAMVAQVREKACEVDPRGCWYAFGTARLPDDSPRRPGLLNGYFSDVLKMCDVGHG